MKFTGYSITRKIKNIFIIYILLFKFNFTHTVLGICKSFGYSNKELHSTKEELYQLHLPLQDIYTLCASVLLTRFSLVWQCSYAVFVALTGYSMVWHCFQLSKS